MTTWNTEDDGEQLAGQQLGESASLVHRRLDALGAEKVKQGYVTKAYLVLVDSDRVDGWGVIEDTMNNLLWMPGVGEVVGTWSRVRYDNLIHISLATSISALQDRSIQTFAKYAEERRNASVAKTPSKRAARAKAAAHGQPEEQAQEPVLSVDQKMEFNTLRARMGRAK